MTRLEIFEYYLTFGGTLTQAIDGVLSAKGSPQLTDTQIDKLRILLNISKTAAGTTYIEIKREIRNLLKT